MCPIFAISVPLGRFVSSELSVLLNVLYQIVLRSNDDGGARGGHAVLLGG